jgi:hypothetical protein
MKLKEFFKAVFIVALFVIAEIIFQVIRSMIRKKRQRIEQRRKESAQIAAVREDVLLNLTDLLNQLRDEKIYWLEIYSRLNPDERLLVEKSHTPGAGEFCISGLPVFVKQFARNADIPGERSEQSLSFPDNAPDCARAIIGCLEEQHGPDISGQIEFKY